MSKNFDGYKYFVDDINDNQYAILFENGDPTMILGVNAQNNVTLNIADMIDKDLMLIDDETKELYTVKLTAHGAVRETLGLEVNKIKNGDEVQVNTLPSKHLNGANVARSKVEQYIENKEIADEMMESIERVFSSVQIDTTDIIDMATKKLEEHRDNDKSEIQESFNGIAEMIEELEEEVQQANKLIIKDRTMTKTLDNLDNAFQVASDKMSEDTSTKLDISKEVTVSQLKELKADTVGKLNKIIEDKKPINTDRTNLYKFRHLRKAESMKR